MEGSRGGRCTCNKGALYVRLRGGEQGLEKTTAGAEGWASRNGKLGGGTSTLERSVQPAERIGGKHGATGFGPKVSGELVKRPGTENKVLGNSRKKKGRTAGASDHEWLAAPPVGQESFCPFLHGLKGRSKTRFARSVRLMGGVHNTGGVASLQKRGIKFERRGVTKMQFLRKAEEE